MNRKERKRYLTRLRIRCRSTKKVDESRSSVQVPERSPNDKIQDQESLDKATSKQYPNAVERIRTPAKKIFMPAEKVLMAVKKISISVERISTPAKKISMSAERV